MEERLGLVIEASAVDNGKAHRRLVVACMCTIIKILL